MLLCDFFCSNNLNIFVEVNKIITYHQYSLLKGFLIISNARRFFQLRRC